MLALTFCAGHLGRKVSSRTIHEIFVRAAFTKKLESCTGVRSQKLQTAQSRVGNTCTLSILHIKLLSPHLNILVIMKTVGVIGLGPAGLSVVKELKEAGLEPTGFDRSCRVGGRWSLDGDAGIWKELCMNGTRRTMEFSDFTWHDECFEGYENAYGGVFPHNVEVCAYMDAYAKNFDLYPNIQLKTQVNSITQEENGSWTVITQKDGKAATHTFDALVVCSGMHAKPFHPLQDTFKDFDGEVLHSQQFRSLSDYKGTSVLVIGSSITGGEISAGLANEGDCAKIVNSVRHAPYHMDKFSKTTKQPIDHVLFIRLPAWLGRFLPDSIATKGLKSTILEHCPQQITEEIAGMKPNEDIRYAGGSVSVNYMDNLMKNKIQVKPAVVSAKGRCVTFEDGSTEEFDTVICATGYETDLSFLPQHVQDKVLYKSPFGGTTQVALYKHTLVPGIDNIAFAGIVNNIGPQFAMAEMQARYLAAIFSGRLSRPNDEQLLAGVRAFKKFREASPFNALDSMPMVCEDIGGELGVTPSYLEGLLNAKDLLLSPLYPCYYRTNPKVEGVEKAGKFQKVFGHYIATPQHA